ncbi:MAG: methyltransferase domain-containing protein [Candidatus Delongbacteria bacterium]|nr:methyltransferase domain-containing protein [Candidatus Delongbacteria bacterium]
MFSSIKQNCEFYKKKYYRGNDIYCPFCPGFFKAERYPFSKEISLNCPVCGSTLEERTVLLFLQTKTEMMSGEKKILVIAEPGKIADYFGSFPNTVLKIYTETGDFSIRDNSLKERYTDGEFDLIICNYILEKIPQHEMVIKELKRIIKPDGIIMLQAYVDYEKDKTVEMSVTHYKDRLSLYGIPGNYRRFGKDYPGLIRSFGLNMSRLKFTSGFERIPEKSINRDEIIYLAHTSDKPMLSDNSDVLEQEIAVQEKKTRGGLLTGWMYIAFFVFPESVKRSLISLLGNFEDRQDNKGKFIYMVYILFVGLFLYWGTLGFFLMTSHSQKSLVQSIHMLIGWPLFIVGGFFGLAIMAGYVFLNDRVGLFKKSIVAVFLLLSMWLPIASGFIFR